MRDELKYVLPVDALPRVRHALNPFMRLDEHCIDYEERGYTVRSIYLDSSSLRYYHEKIGHLQHRKKVRIRGYNEPNGTVFLEIKRKDDSAVSKDRAPMPYADLEPLFRTGRFDAFFRTTSDAAVGRRVCYHVFKNDLRPTCLVVYEREAYEGRFDDSFRITLDRNIRGAMYPRLDGLYEAEGLVEVLPGYFVIEVKFDTRLPAWMRQVIAEFGLMQRAASKYCICVDAFDRRIDTMTAVRACASPVSSLAERPVAAAPAHGFTEASLDGSHRILRR